MMIRKIAALAVLVAFAACADTAVEPESADGPAFAVGQAPAIDLNAARGYLDGINARLVVDGATYAVAQAEWLLAPTADPASPNVVFASDHDLRLPFRWVPNDVRRLADGENLTYAVFQPLAFANVLIPAEPAIDAAFETWNSVACSQLPIVKRTLPPGVFPSAIFGLPGFVNDPLAADIANIGFLPGSFFDDVLGPGASSNVLGVTFTFVFVDGNGDPTDVNGDHRLDTALKEIWYNDDFVWSTDGSGGIDIETVVLHEGGHGLELGHFGSVVGNFKKGTLRASPRAVMNAFILGTLRSPLGTDDGAYCGNYASWPN